MTQTLEQRAPTQANHAEMVAALADILAQTLHTAAAGSSAGNACEGISHLARQIGGDLHDLADDLPA